MTADTALYDFFNQFDIPAYPETAVPDDVKMPYITYPFSVSFLDNGEVYASINVWYKSESEAIPTAKAMEIVEAIGRAGNCLNIDGGYVWVKLGNPTINVIPDEDNSVKRRVINLIYEYLT